MKKIVSYLIPSALVVALCVFGSIQLYARGAEAQTTDVTSLDAGVPDAMETGSGSATPAPHTTIDDPIDNPAAAVDDLKTAKAVGWGPLVFALLVMLGLFLRRLKNTFAFLKTKKGIILTAAIGSIGATGFDALMLGGHWIAVMSAIIVAGATAITIVDKDTDAAKSATT